MAKTEIQGRQFTKCDGFWDPEEGEQFTGVLIDCNEKFPDKIKGDKATKPLYILKSIGDAKEKPSLYLDDKPVKNAKGVIVGIFDSSDLYDKIFGKYADLVGKEITVKYDKKESFTAKGGAARSIKRFKVMAEDHEHSEFGKFAVRRTLAAPMQNGKADETLPYDVG